MLFSNLISFFALDALILVYMLISNLMYDNVDLFLCYNLIKPNNIGEQERQGMMFTTTTQAKYLNGL